MDARPDALADALPDAASASWRALAAAATVTRTPCGEGAIVWRSWGGDRKEGGGDGGEHRPLVLLHGGAGSWLHWLRTIPAFAGPAADPALAGGRRVLAPDLPGLGDSAPPPRADVAGYVDVVADGLDRVLGREARFDLAGFSFGGVVSGHLAARMPGRVGRLVLVGSGGLGVIRGSARLERVRDKVGAEREAAHRANLLRWMIAEPGAVDDEAVAIQDWNSRRARFDSRPIGIGDSLVAALAGGHPGLAGIWGARDHAMQGEPWRAEAALRRLGEGASPDLPFRVVPGAGHWVAHEAPDAFNATLRDLLAEPRE